MLYLFLDESGDLGFDFINKKPSNFFTITILVINSYSDNRALINAVKKTLKRKLNLKNKNKIHELKGSSTNFEIKNYFYAQAKNANFSLYSISLDKKKIFGELIKNKNRIYSFIARNIVDKIMSDFDNFVSVEFIVDRSMGKPEIEDFNKNIKNQLEARIDPKIRINIRHRLSHEDFNLQACDVFSHGIFTSHERGKGEWRKVFEEKIKCDEVYDGI